MQGYKFCIEDVVGLLQAIAGTNNFGGLASKDRVW